MKGSYHRYRRSKNVYFHKKSLILKSINTLVVSIAVFLRFSCFRLCFGFQFPIVAHRKISKIETTIRGTNYYHTNHRLLLSTMLFSQRDDDSSPTRTLTGSEDKEQEGEQTRIRTLYEEKICCTQQDVQGQGQYCDPRTTIDELLECLVSPAPESFHIIVSTITKLNEIQECMSTSTPMCTTFLSLLLDLRALSHYVIKPGHALELSCNSDSDANTISKSRVTWRVVKKRRTQSPSIFYPAEMEVDHSIASVKELYHDLNCLQLSHMALDITTSDTGQGTNDDNSNKESNQYSAHDVADAAEKRIILTMGSDLRGRKSSDACYNFALAGITNSNHGLFESLICIGIHELKRVGNRASFQPKYILQMMEKFAASGIQGSSAMEFYRLGGDCLVNKGYDDQALLEQLQNGSFGFHSDRPLLWLWRFSARQRKVSLSEYYRTKLLTSRSKEVRPWHDIFSDVNRPLVVDVGSGMGASMLNLLSVHRKNDKKKKAAFSDSDSGEISINWSECNYAGADLNLSMVNFGNGVISRNEKRYNGRVSFFHMEALEFLTEVQSYPGNIAMVMIHFPSPYRLKMASGSTRTNSGNSQLPTSLGSGFMVSRRLLELISDLLLPNSNSSKDDAGVFLFQTKCEDVGVRVKNDCLSLGTMECVPCKYPVKSIDRIYDNNGKCEGKGEGKGRPKRVKEWRKIDPCAERAEGNMWSSVPLLPSKGRPETEVQCEYENTIVHRCMFRSCMYL